MAPRLTPPPYSTTLVPTLFWPVIRLCLREDTTMPRCTLGLILAFTLLIALLAAEAQSRAKIPRVGVLRHARHADEPQLGHLEDFRHGLRELGYIEG